VGEWASGWVRGWVVVVAVMVVPVVPLRGASGVGVLVVVVGGWVSAWMGGDDGAGGGVGVEWIGGSGDGDSTLVVVRRTGGIAGGDVQWIGSGDGDVQWW
jgi:hypothetical protein